MANDGQNWKPTAAEFLNFIRSVIRTPNVKSSETHEWEILDQRKFLTIKNAIVSGHLAIKDDDTKNLNLRLQNCTFNGLVSFYTTRLSSLILDSEFQNKLTITNGRYHFIHFTGGQYSGDVILTNNRITSSLELSGGTYDETVNLSDNDFGKIVKFSGGRYKSIQIKSSDFKSGIEISSIEVQDKIEFTGGDFAQAITIQSGEFQGSLKLSGGHYIKGYKILGGSFHSSIEITNGEFSEELEIRNGNFKDLSISGGIFNHGLSISGGNFEKEIKLSGGKYGGDISIANAKNNLTIDAISISASYSGLSVALEGLNLNQINLTGLSMLKKLRLVGINLPKKGNTLTIENSTLSGTELIGCDFENAKLSVDNSNLLGLFYTDTLLPKEVNSSEVTDQKRDEQVRDTYSQLKTVAEKQNDRQSSLYFQSKANHKLFSLAKSNLTSKKGSWLNYFNPFRKGWGEFFQLFLNKWSNGFGQSYLRALVVFVILTIPLYVLYVLVISPEINLGLDCSYTLKVFLNYWGDYFQFINPLRPVNFLHEKTGCIEPSGWIRVIDWFSRIVIFYLSYQFVQAFRKYGRA